jgi:hypothetical protein
MLELSFFRNPRFTAAAAAIVLMTFALYASTFLMTLYFQFTLGYSPVKTGLMMTPVAVGMMLSATQAARAVERFGTKVVSAGGLAIVGLGVACYGSNMIMSGLTVGVIVRFVYGIGLGFTGPPLTESVMGSLPLDRAGVGSAINDTTRQVGGALGVAVLGSVFAARYHQAMDGATAIPAALRHQARESIGTTLTVASRLDDRTLAARLRETGIGAFHSSMRLTYGLGAAIVAAAVYLVWRWLPDEDLDQNTAVVEIPSEPPLAAAIELEPELS